MSPAWSTDREVIPGQRPTQLDTCSQSNGFGAHHCRWSRRYGPLKLPYLPTSADVISGISLVTVAGSAVDSRPGLPGGLPVAEVK